MRPLLEAPGPFGEHEHAGRDGNGSPGGARYVGGSLAVAAVATIFSTVTENHQNAGASPSDALAAGLSRSSLMLAIFTLSGVGLVVLMGRHRGRKPQAIDRAAAAAITAHTIPTAPAATS